MTSQQVRLLMLDAPITANAVADELGVDRRKASGVLTALKQGGFARVCHTSKGKRGHVMKWYELTPFGRAITKKKLKLLQTKN